MNEIFYEESAGIQNKTSAKTKYHVCNVMSILSFVLLVVWVLFIIIGYEFSNILIDLIIILLPSAVFIALGIIMGKLKKKFYVDFDYTFVSGSVRFSRVIMNSSRESILKFETKQIEKLGYYGSETFEKYDNSPIVIKEVLTSNSEPCENKDFYYLVVNSDGDKYLFILECTKTFILNIIKFSNKSILDEEFIKAISRTKKS